MISPYVLDVPELRDEPGERLTRPRFLFLEALYILGFGEARDWVFDHQSSRLMNRQWRSILTGKALVLMAEADLIQPAPVAYAHRLTTGGLLEHAQQRGRFFSGAPTVLA